MTAFLESIPVPLRIELAVIAVPLIGFGIRRLDREIARGTRRYR